MHQLREQQLLHRLHQEQRHSSSLRSTLQDTHSQLQQQQQELERLEGEVEERSQQQLDLSWAVKIKEQQVRGGAWLFYSAETLPAGNSIQGAAGKRKVLVCSIQQGHCLWAALCKEQHVRGKARWVSSSRDITCRHRCTRSSETKRHTWPCTSHAFALKKGPGRG